MYFVQTRLRRVSGTTLAELLVASVFAAAAIGGIMGATTAAVNRVQLMNARAIAASLAQGQMDCAKTASRLGILAAGTRVVTYTTTGGVSISGQNLSCDYAPAASASSFGGSLVLTRTTAAEAGVTDVFRVTVTAAWTPAGGTASGRTQLSLDTFMRSPCD